MREIKFRAWDGKNKRMVYAFWVASLSGLPFWTVQQDEVGKEIKIMPINSKFILMQYTDLKDRTGKMIFEGDILRSTTKHHDPNILRDVRWDNAGFTMFTDDTSSGYKISSEAKRSEIIGNIYENKDLL